jgi:hypothetical protein
MKYVSGVYAELSPSQFKKVSNNEYTLSVPYDVKLTNRAGSRVLRFACNTAEASRELIEGLDDSSIAWQEEIYANDGISEEDSN